MVSLANEKAAALQQAVVHAKLNGQSIDKRKSIDSTNDGTGNQGGVVMIKKGRLPSRKMEPLAHDGNHAAKSITNAKVSPFLAGGAQFIGVENAAATISNISLGLPAQNQLSNGANGGLSDLIGP